MTEDGYLNINLLEYVTDDGYLNITLLEYATDDGYLRNVTGKRGERHWVEEGHWL